MPEKQPKKHARTPEVKVIEYTLINHALKISVSSEHAEEMDFSQKFMLGIIYPKKQIKIEVKKS